MASVNKEMLLAGLKEYFTTPEMVQVISEIFDGPFKLGKIAKMVAMGSLAIDVVEKLVYDAEEVGKGGAKRDAVVTWVDDIVELPFYLEMLDGPVIKASITAIVTVRNIRYGKNWIEIIKNFL